MTSSDESASTRVLARLCHRQNLTSCRLSVTLVAVCLTSLPALANAQQATTFATASLPNGVVTDLSGNVYVYSENDISPVLSVFNPKGVAEGSVSVPGYLDGSHLARIPGSTYLMMLRQGGQMVVLNPANRAPANFWNATTLSIDTSAVYDVATKRTSNMGSLIQPATATYGDLAIVLRTSSSGLPGFDYFVTGQSQTGAYPFVIRIRLNPSGITAKVVATSSAQPGLLPNPTHGIAVNTSGLVVTTLPTQLNYGSIDSLVSFNADFPETKTGLPATPMGTGLFTSNGMDSDASGDFYVATGAGLTGLLAIYKTGAMVKLSSDGSKVLNYVNVSGSSPASKDVAVTSAGDKVYMTVYTSNSVLVMPTN